jgi:hypothetical protein
MLRANFTREGESRPSLRERALQRTLTPLTPLLWTPYFRAVNTAF